MLIKRVKIAAISTAMKTAKHFDSWTSMVSERQQSFQMANRFQDIPDSSYFVLPVQCWGYIWKRGSNNPDDELWRRIRGDNQLSQVAVQSWQGWLNNDHPPLRSTTGLMGNLRHADGTFLVLGDIFLSTELDQCQKVFPAPRAFATLLENRRNKCQRSLMMRFWSPKRRHKKW